MLTVLSGGGLAVLFLARELVAGRGAGPGSRASLPYGVAIAAGRHRRDAAGILSAQAASRKRTPASSGLRKRSSAW